jgi:WD40 repeat protein
MRFGTVRWQAPAHALAYTPNGRTIAFANWNEVGTIDAETGKQLSRVTLQRPGTMKFGDHILSRFSKDCKTLVSIESGPGKVRFWDVRSGKLLREFPAAIGFPVCLASASDGSRIAAANQYHNFYLWDAATGLTQSPSDAEVGQDRQDVWMAFSPNSRLLATAVQDRFIRVWDLNQSRMIHEFKVRPGAMGFTKDGKKVTCLVSNSHEIKFWDVATGKEGASIQVPAEEPVNNFEDSYDGKHLAVRGADHVFLWSLPERKLVRSLPVSGEPCFVFSPDSKRLACSNGVSISVWDTATGRQLNPRPGHTSPVDHIVFSPDGKVLASCEWSEKNLVLWDMGTGNQVAGWRLGRLCGPPSFSATGKLLVIGDWEHGIQLRDVATGNEMRLFTDHNWKEVGSLEGVECRLSQDGKRLAALGCRSREASQVRVWDASTGDLLARRLLPECDPACLSPDCRLLAFAVVDQSKTDNGPGSWLYVQEAATGHELLKIATGEIANLVFSSDSKTLMAMRHKTLPSDQPEIYIWEVATGKERLRFGTGDFYPVAWSPDARLLATEDFHEVLHDGISLEIGIWDAAIGKMLFRIQLSPQHRLGYSAHVFATDSRSISLGMPDTTILTWQFPREVARPAITAGGKLESNDLERLWADLAGPDATKAHKAIWALIGAPERAVPFLNGKLHAIAPEDLKAMERRIVDLDSPDFSVRAQADKALRNAGLVAEPALRQALQKNLSPEARHRLEALLSAVPDQVSESLAHLRALEVLERIGTEGAKRVLQRLAAGVPTAHLTEEAKHSWERLSVQLHD